MLQKDFYRVEEAETVWIRLGLCPFGMSLVVSFGVICFGLLFFGLARSGT